LAQPCLLEHGSVRDLLYASAIFGFAASFSPLYGRWGSRPCSSTYGEANLLLELPPLSVSVAMNCTTAILQAPCGLFCKEHRSCSMINRFSRPETKLLYSVTCRIPAASSDSTAPSQPLLGSIANCGEPLNAGFLSILGIQAVSTATDMPP
jgi:hypothetical protein